MRIILEMAHDGTFTDSVLTEPMDVSEYEFTPLLREFQARGFSHFTWHRLDMVCDFCSTPRVTWRYQIPPGGHLGSAIAGGEEHHHIDRDGTWGACAECHALISGGDEPNWVGLLARSVMRFREMHGQMVPDEMIAVICSGPHGCFERGFHAHTVKPVVTDDELLDS